MRSHVFHLQKNHQLFKSVQILSFVLIASLTRGILKACRPFPETQFFPPHILSHYGDLEFDDLELDRRDEQIQDD